MPMSGAEYVQAARQIKVAAAQQQTQQRKGKAAAAAAAKAGGGKPQQRATAGDDEDGDRDDVRQAMRELDRFGFDGDDSD